MIRGGPDLAGDGSPFPNAEQALLLSAAIGPADGVEDTFDAWRSKVDFDCHLDGGSYRLLPLLYTRLANSELDSELSARLKAVYRHAWFTNRTFFQEAKVAIELLESAGIRTMVLKGAPLALTHYASPAARPMADLDVLVRHADKARAIAVLRGAGWTPGPMVHAHEVEDQHALDFRKDGRVEIDLHFRVLREAPSDAADAWFWAGAIPFDFCGVPTLQPGATAMLFHVAVHGLRSNLEPPIRWIADAATVIRANGDAIDWDALVRFARAQGMSYRLWLALHYLSTSHDLPIPAHVLKRLRARGVSLVERVENYLYLGPAQRMYKPLIFPALDYWRYLRADRPGQLIMRYPAYLKRRWQSRSKTQIARAAGVYVTRTLRTKRPHPPGSD